MIYIVITMLALAVIASILKYMLMIEDNEPIYKTEEVIATDDEIEEIENLKRIINYQITIYGYVDEKNINKLEELEAKYGL